MKTKNGKNSVLVRSSSIQINKDSQQEGGPATEGALSGAQPDTELLGTLPRPSESLPFLVVVLIGLFATLLVYGCALLDTGIVCFELDASVRGEVEDMLHGFTKAYVSKPVRRMKT